MEERKRIDELTRELKATRRNLTSEIEKTETAKEKAVRLQNEIDRLLVELARLTQKSSEEMERCDGLSRIMEEERHALQTIKNQLAHYKMETEQEKARWDNERRNNMTLLTSECLSEGAAREWSTVVKISIPPLSFKPVTLSLSRSPLL